MRGCRAVDADRDDSRRRVGEREGRFDRFAAPRARPVAAGEAEPGRWSGRLLKQLDERLCLVERGDRLQGEHVGLALGQDRQTRSMEVTQFAHGQAVVAVVLGSVGQHRAIRADRGRDPQGGRLTPGRDDLGPIRRPGFGRQGNALAQDVLRLGPVDAALGEALEGRLVAGRGGNSRAGPEIGQVGGHDLARRFDQQTRGPEQVGQVVSALLQLGREAAIEDEDGVLMGQRREGVQGHVPIVQPWFRSPGNGPSGRPPGQDPAAGSRRDARTRPTPRAERAT